MNVNQLIAQFRNTTGGPAEVSYDFLVKHRRDIVNVLGYNAWKEMTLNYRTYFAKHQKVKIVNAFKRWVMTKQVHHNSDIVIAYNIINFVGVDKPTEELIVNFIFDRLKEKLTVVSKAQEHYFLKKHLVMDYIDKNIRNQRVE